MRQFMLGLSISIAFILGCVTAQHVPTMAMPSASASTQAPVEPGKRWEYLCEEAPNVKMTVKANVEVRAEFLNRYGADGWEYIPESANGGLGCFKRPT